MTSKGKVIYHQTIQCEHFHNTSEDISRLATTPAVEFSVDLIQVFTMLYLIVSRGSEILDFLAH